MKTASYLVTPCIRAILKVLCRVDCSELKKVPATGPLIIVINHINFLEVPMLYSFLYPREIIGIIKAETWDNPLIGALASVWSAIPINRGTADMTAMRGALRTLSRGGMLAIAPEGTRSGDGRLREGHAGVVLIAARSGAPILPIAHYGGESFWKNLRAFRKTPFHFRVGEPYTLKVPEGGLGRAERQRCSEDIMLRIAALLPKEYRGFYADRI